MILSFNIDAPHHCCAGRRNSEGIKEPVPEACMGLCHGYELQKEVLETKIFKRRHYCDRFADTIKLCYKRFQNFMNEHNASKICFNKNILF